jgi:hypothetical protein
MNFKSLFQKLIVVLSLLIVYPLTISAQRIQQSLNRGVVAVYDDSKVFVSWRKLVQEPDNTSFNIYRCDANSTNYTKINENPVVKTNFSTTTSVLPYGSKVAVTSIVNGIESEKSEPFSFNNQPYRCVFLNINYSSLLPTNEYVTKFVWPADLDGDGEYDYIVDRLSTTDISTRSNKIEGYLRDGTYLWTVDMGPNAMIDRGQDDMVLAYDMNCDGKAEVVVKSSDGTRFWDKQNNTWGKYVNGSTNGDTDNDGIVDYNAQTVKNPPFYITVINGMTGAEMNSIEMDYSKLHDGSDQYSRTNKASYMDDGYNLLNGHMGICYLDGIHPSVVMEYLDRTLDGVHHNYVSAWGYKFAGNKATDFTEHFTWSRNDKTPWPAEFHMIRIGDVDLDGKDEMIEGGYTLDDNGTMLFSAGIGHGDRFRTGDLNPDRPGLETYAIQQSSLLGQLLYDAATGKHIKEWYLGSVTDVGRGECMDVDKSHKGYEIFSTMPNLYDCNGNLITEGATPFPTEGIWWDGELDREMLCSSDGHGFNAMVTKYNGSRLIEFAKESGWTVNSTYGCRPMFFGDIIGDWRDEVILKKGDTSSTTGIIGYSTSYSTDYSIYCLQQDPSYRMDCTTRGYYQSPMTDFYLGYDMPNPPLPPSIVTDLRWQSGTQWDESNKNFCFYDFSDKTSSTTGKSVMFDISGDNSSPIKLSGSLSPTAVYVMNPVGHDYVWNIDGGLVGKMNLWKSMNGKLTINGDLAYTGNTIVSEGNLTLNGKMMGPFDLKAKGTLSGNVTLCDTAIFEGGLNYEGCRLSPGTADKPYGTILSNHNMTLPGGVYIEENLQTEGDHQADVLKINGDLILKGINFFTIIPAESKPVEGTYILVSCSGKLSATADNIKIRGLVGLNYNVQIGDHDIELNIKGTRDASNNVFWTGTENGTWDYTTQNFSLEDQATTFVANDTVYFNDDVNTSSILLNEKMVTSGLNFNNNSSTYTLSGNGGLSGVGGLTKMGLGALYLNCTQSDYTGPTSVSGGNLLIKSLADGGQPSSIGAAPKTVGNFNLSHCTLTINNTNAVTDRILALQDTVNINVPSGYASFKSDITGKGTLVKTGSGQLNIVNSGATTYSGGTILKGGTLAQGSWNASFGAYNSNLTLQGGTIVIAANNNTSTVPTLHNTVTVVDATTNNINASQRCSIGGTFSGGGTLNISIPYVRTDINANWSNFTGTLNVTGNTLRFNDTQNLSKAILNLGDNVSLGHYKGGSGTTLERTSNLGALQSSYATSSVIAGTYNIGYRNTDATFAGSLKCTAINKYGTGSWTLSGSGSTAPINVYNGTLRINNTTGSATVGNITVANGAVIEGTGQVNNVTLQKGAVIGAGNSSTVGTLSVAGNLYLNTGATVRVKIHMLSNDKISCNGKTTFNDDTLLIQSYLKKYKAGDEITIFTGSGIRTGKLIIVPSVPAEGLAWDDSELLSDGILKIAETAAITSIASDQVVDVYNEGGILIRQNVIYAKALSGLAHGVYILKIHGASSNKTFHISY